ncbi:MAG: flagellar export chaperone FliS [Gallionella sp.]|jgi:flagellar protein FliS|nr:flagellar export chaperone FliS [Gallionella sp.]MCK9354949.1 flagellar export chaperone FliS [Gallionella sp.]
MNASLAIKAYTNVGVESNVIAADPHRLISMLYQGALQAIANAKNAIQRKDIPAKCSAISKALLIIDEGLNASLDKKVGGELAGNLSSLYNYMCSRLAQANLKNDIAALDEVSTLLADLKGAWDNIRPPAASANAVTPLPISTAEPLSRPAAISRVQMAYGRA